VSDSSEPGDSPTDGGPGNSAPAEAGAPELGEAEARARLGALSRRGFLVAGAATVGALGVGRWLTAGASQEAGLAWPLRRALLANEAITRVLVSPHRLAPTFSRAAIAPLRANGDLGLDDETEDDGWRVQLRGAAGFARAIDLGAIRALPRTEMTTEFKCIEGWSVVAHWAGARFADFARAFPPPTRSGRPFDPDQPDDAPPYVAMATPDGEYYVGLDAASALHPQTLLAWELNDEALSPEHGAPLRLVIPVKYGVKNIKRIGLITWSNARPSDYWHERGYDWFCGL